MDGFKDLFQGGNCNPQLQQMNTNNAFKNFMNNLTQSSGQLNNFQEMNSQQGLNMMMNDFNLVWQTGEKNFLMEQQRQQMEFQKMWQMEQERIEFQKKTQSLSFPIFQSKIEQQEIPLQNWNQSFVLTPNIQQPFFEKIKEDEKIENKEIEEMEDDEKHYQANDELIHMMETDPDPKFQKSEFLEFLKNIQSRKYEIKNNILIVNKEPKSAPSLDKLTKNYEEYIKQQIDLDNNIEQHLIDAQEESNNITKENKNEFVDFVQNQENAFNDIIKERAEEGEEGEKIKEEKNEEKDKIGKMWQDMLDNYNENDPELKEKLEKIWSESLKNYETYNDTDYLAESWQLAGDMEEMQYQNFNDHYDFAPDNKFKDLQNPLSELKNNLSQGNPHLVVEILEAHLQKNPQDSNGWKALGILLQELDVDQPSVSCLLNALKYSPNDANVLLQLGVSCTNIFDKIHAMSFLE
jgi:hypothetical protein